MMQNTKGIFYSGLMLIFPAALLITGWLYIRNSGLYFLHCVDPEFAYLFNGVTLAHLHPDLNCAGHPGTPVQVLIALISMAAFMVFAFPVMFSIPKFVRWVTLIFTHKGVYGSGERGIIDWEVFIRNLEGMWDATRMLIIPFGILAVTVILYIIRNRRNKPFSATSVRIFLALSSVLLMQYFITAKHYALYYMTPSLLLSAFVVFMIFLFLGLLFPGLERKKVFTLLLGIFGLWFVFPKAPQVVRNLNHRLEATVIKTEAYKKIAPFLKATPKIICPNYYGCSSVEYALTFGLHESGKHAHYIFERMEKLYPCTYMFFLWRNVFYEGYKTILPASFMQFSATYTLYIADYSQEQLNQVLANMQTDLPGYTYDLTKLYYSPSTTEAVFLLKVKDADFANEPVKKMNQ